jgi:hypothetical protein
MTIEILDAVLSFSIDGFVQLLADSRALFFRFSVVSIDIGHDDREHLSSISDRRRALSALTSTSQHDGCLAQLQLGAAYRLAVTEVLGKSEYPRWPVTSIDHDAVHKTRKYGCSRNGVVIHAEIVSCEFAPTIMGVAESFLLASDRPLRR